MEANTLQTAVINGRTWTVPADILQIVENGGIPVIRQDGRNTVIRQDARTTFDPNVRSTLLRSEQRMTARRAINKILFRETGKTLGKRPTAATLARFGVTRADLGKDYVQFDGVRRAYEAVLR